MKLSIEGMHCQACVKRVQKALEKVEGAQVETVEIGSARVAVKPEQEPAVLEAVRQAGYQVHAE
jgi:copper chaperone CopZ